MSRGRLVRGYSYRDRKPLELASGEVRARIAQARAAGRLIHLAGDPVIVAPRPPGSAEPAEFVEEWYLERIGCPHQREREP